MRADFHGTRTPAALGDDLEVRARALATRLRPDQFLSHLTAARLWGMRLPFRDQLETLHVTTVLPGRTVRLRGVVGHHATTPVPERMLHRGFVLPTPEETWRSLGSLLSVRDLVIAADGLVARREPLSTISRLRRAVARNSGQRGNLRLRAAFEATREHTDSPRETGLRLDVVAAGLPEPDVNGVISEPGEPLRFGDLVFRDLRVVAEYEGAHHQEDRRTYLSDIDRFAQLAGRWTFVRIAKEHSRTQAVDRIRSALLAAGWRP